MVTQEEKEEIIAAAIERTLLAIPEVVGNLMANHAALHKINMKFYSDYPEFRDRKDIVQAVVEQFEGKNPVKSYDELLEEAVPEIKRRMLIAQDVDVETVPKDVPRDYKDTDFSQNGVL